LEGVVNKRRPTLNKKAMKVLEENLDNPKKKIGL